MLRDELMQHIISRDKEPITPFIERARDLFVKAGISTVLVAGSSGAYFYIADTIIQMDCYVPLDITEKTKKACAEYGEDRSEAPYNPLHSGGGLCFGGGDHPLRISTVGPRSVYHPGYRGTAVGGDD